MTQMLRSCLFTAAMVLAAPASLVITTDADAQSHSGLRAAADRYRDAAVHFDHHVHRAGYFNVYEKRLADRLEDVSGEFRSATRNTRDVPRLLYHYDELLATQGRVEAALVRGCSRPDPELLPCWRQVLEAAECIREEMQCFLHHGQPHTSARPPLTTPGRGRPWNDDWRYSQPAWPSSEAHDSHFHDPRLGDPRFSDPRFREPRLNESSFVDPRGIDPRFESHRLHESRISDPFAPVPRQPAIQRGPQAPLTPGRSLQVNSRREVGAAIAATILNQLLN